MIREEDVIFNDPLQYPRPRVKRELPRVVEIKVNHLPPYSDITLQIRVLNKYYAGPPSPTIQFTTLEGGKQAHFVICAVHYIIYQ